MTTPDPEDKYPDEIAELLAALVEMLDNPSERNRRIVAEMRLSVRAPQDPPMEEKDSLYRFVKERKEQAKKTIYSPSVPPYDPLKGDMWIDTSYAPNTAETANKYVMNETIRKAVSAEIEAKLVEQMKSYSQFVTWDPTKKNPPSEA